MFTRDQRKAGRGPLGRQPFDPPGFAFAGIAKAIVQTVGTALPEFDSLRFHPITAPVRWTGNFLTSKSLFQFRKPCFQNPARINYIALVRDPGPELAAKRARMKIAGRFFPRNFFGDAVDPDLSLQFLPVN